MPHKCGLFIHVPQPRMSFKFIRSLFDEWVDGLYCFNCGNKYKREQYEIL